MRSRLEQLGTRQHLHAASPGRAHCDARSRPLAAPRRSARIRDRPPEPGRPRKSSWRDRLHTKRSKRLQLAVGQHALPAPPGMVQQVAMRQAAAADRAGPSRARPAASSSAECERPARRGPGDAACCDREPSANRSSCRCRSPARDSRRRCATAFPARPALRRSCARTVGRAPARPRLPQQPGQKHRRAGKAASLQIQKQRVGRGNDRPRPQARRASRRSRCCARALRCTRAFAQSRSSAAGQSVSSGRRNRRCLPDAFWHSSACANNSSPEGSRQGASVGR